MATTAHLKTKMAAFVSCIVTVFAMGAFVYIQMTEYLCVYSYIYVCVHMEMAAFVLCIVTLFLIGAFMYMLVTKCLYVYSYIYMFLCICDGCVYVCVGI